MKHIFLVRHGQYYHDGDSFLLKPEGIKEMEILSGLIKEISSNNEYCICSSPESVAIESARILAEKLGVRSIDETLELWSGALGPQTNNRSGDPQRVHAILLPYWSGNKNRNSSLVAVSHYEVVKQYPGYFLRHEFGIQKSLSEIPKGHMIHFDIEKRTYCILPKKLF